MFIRKLLVTAAFAGMTLAVPATAALASPTPGWEPPQPSHSYCQPQGDHHNWGNQDKPGDGNCCPQEDQGWFNDGSGFPVFIGNYCVPQFPKPPACHEVTTWVPDWTWKHHHLVETWRPESTWSCDNDHGNGYGDGQGNHHGNKHCTPETLGFTEYLNGMFYTGSAVTVNETLVYGGHDYTVKTVTPGTGIHTGQSLVTFVSTLGLPAGTLGGTNVNFTATTHNCVHV